MCSDRNLVLSPLTQTVMDDLKEEKEKGESEEEEE